MGRAKDVTGFRKIGEGGLGCAGCAKAAGHIKAIIYMQLRYLPESLLERRRNVYRMTR